MKKFLSMLLALMMLTVPMLSMAEANQEGVQKATTIEIALSNANLAELAGDEPMGQAINDLINAIGMTLTVQRNSEASAQVGFSLNLSGAAVLTMDAMLEEKNLAIMSNLLGDDVIVMTEDELLAVLEDNKESIISEGTMTEADYDDLVKQIKNVFSGDYQPFTQGITDANAQLTEADFSKTLEAMQAVLESAKVEEGELTEQPEGCDEAQAVMTIILDSEDLKKVISAMWEDYSANEYFGAYLQVMEQSMALMDEGDQVSLAQTMQQALDETTIDEAVYTVYTDAEGEIVRLEGAMIFVAGDDACKLNLTIVRNTTESVPTYSATIGMAEDDDDVVTIRFDVTEVAENSYVVNGSIAAEDTEVKMYFAMAEAENDTATHVDVKFTMEVVEDGASEGGFALQVAADAAKEGNDAQVVVDILPLESETPYLTVTVTAREAEAKAALRTEDAVHLLSMSEEELEAWSEGVTSTMQIVMIGAIQHLPESVLNLLLQAQ